MCFDVICHLLDINNIPYRIGKIYDEDNDPYNSIWLDKGCFEFDARNILVNIIDY